MARNGMNQSLNADIGDRDVWEGLLPSDYTNFYNRDRSRRTEPDFRFNGPHNSRNCAWVRIDSGDDLVHCSPDDSDAFQVYYGPTDWINPRDADSDDRVKASLIALGWTPPDSAEKKVARETTDRVQSHDRMVLYNTPIGFHQVETHRDDMWAVSTTELNYIRKALE